MVTEPLTDEARLDAALADAKGRSWFDWKNWYNPATRQWFNYRLYPDLDVIVMWPKDNPWHMTAATVDHSVLETVRELFRTEFTERYPEADDDE